VKLHDDRRASCRRCRSAFTSIGILNGIVRRGRAGRAAVAVGCSRWGWETEAQPHRLDHAGVIIITYVTIVSGELVPKRIGLLDPERIACRGGASDDLLALLHAVRAPVCRCRTDAILRLLGRRQSSQPGV